MHQSGKIQWDGVVRRTWKNNAGQEVIESYTIPRMTHGTPLAMGQDENQGGVAGPFMLETGISSSYHIAKFFELTDDVTFAATSGPRPQASSPAMLNRAPENVFGKRIVTSRRIDIGAVIASALRAGGLR